MRFRLRTLMIVLAFLPALAWVTIPPLLRQYREWRANQLIRKMLESHIPLTEAS